MNKNRSPTYAVVDLGTNTFHLLIAYFDFKKNSLIELHRERRFIKMAEDGIAFIGPRAFARGLYAMKHFRGIVNRFEVESERAFGTAALRNAKNAKEFVHSVEQNTGFEIDIIPGNKEAALIYKGATFAVEINDTIPILLMDIGGGSVEFIIADKKGAIWSQSFPIGVAILLRKFHRSDPIALSELEEFNHFLLTELNSFLIEISRHQIKTLIGASGTFDVLQNIVPGAEVHRLHAFIPIDGFQKLQEKIVTSTLAERLEMEELPVTRADMFVVAIQLIDFVLCNSKVNNLLVSHYAMKEGIFIEMVNN